MFESYNSRIDVDVSLLFLVGVCVCVYVGVSDIMIYMNVLSIGILLLLFNELINLFSKFQLINQLNYLFIVYFLSIISRVLGHIYFIYY